jgi:hypothetical protein
MSEVLITIHGVGDAQPDDTTRGLREIIPRIAHANYVAEEIIIADRHYRVWRPNHLNAPKLVELNWSDLRKPPKNPFSTLLHLPAIAAAGLDVDFQWLGTTPVPSWIRIFFRLTQRLFRLTLLSLALWSVFPVFLAMGCHSSNVMHQWIFVCGIVTVVGAMTWTMKDWGRSIVVGGCVCLAAIVGIFIFFKCGKFAIEDIGASTAIYYGATQQVVAGLLAILAILVLLAIVTDRKNWLRYLAVLSMNYIPMLLLAVLGTVLWAFALYTNKQLSESLGDDVLGQSKWNALFLENVGYNLKIVEFVMLGASIVISILVGLVFIIYLVAYRGDQKGRRHSGNTARKGLAFLLVAMPLVLMVPGITLVLSSRLDFWHTDVSALMGYGIFQIYLISAARVVSLAPFLIPKFRIVLDIVGDVAFYICRPGTSLCIRDECNGRLKELVAHFAAHVDIQKIQIVAHSQGTMIAYDVLQCNGPGNKIDLVTMGSPIRTLYGDFLGYRIHPLNLKSWTNLYRDGDYIGGDILKLPNPDDNLGAGEHANYWSDPRIARYIEPISNPR